MKHAIKQWVANKAPEKETLKDKVLRTGFNLFPAHFMTGGKTIYYSSEHAEMLAKIPVMWRTKGWFGQMFGGKMYSATDALPLAVIYSHMDDVRNYIIWDKEGSIKYLKPAYKTVLLAHIFLTDEQKQDLKDDLDTKGVSTVTISFFLEDVKGNKYAKIDKVVHVEKKERFKQRKKKSVE